jgi:hypothetical protein
MLQFSQNLRNICLAQHWEGAQPIQVKLVVFLNIFAKLCLLRLRQELATLEVSGIRQQSVIVVCPWLFLVIFLNAPLQINFFPCSYDTIISQTCNCIDQSLKLT